MAFSLLKAFLKGSPRAKNTMRRTDGISKVAYSYVGRGSTNADEFLEAAANYDIRTALKDIQSGVQCKDTATHGPAAVELIQEALELPVG